MIRIKSLLSEQPGATIKAKPMSSDEKRELASATVKPFDAKKVADLIYNAKGYFWDDEQFAKLAIERNIKNIQQYTAVTKELQKLSGGEGVGAYLRSFMKMDDRLDVVNHLLNVIPKQHWDWTIKQIIPWEDFKYLNHTMGVSDALGFGGNETETASQSNAATKLIQVYSKEWKSRDAELWKEFRHNMLSVGELVTAFIPIIGPVISAGLGLANAKLYLDEGDNYQAGLYAVLSLVPGVGALAKKVGVKSFLNNLIKKVVSKSGVLTRAEREVLLRAASSKDAIKAKMAKIVADGIESGKLNPNALKSIKWIRPAGKGLYNVAWGGVKYGVVPIVGYNIAYDALNPPLTDAEIAVIMYNKLNAKLNSELNKK